MRDRTIGRRTSLQGAGIVPAQAGAQIAVPNSSGVEPVKLKAPANACDCHHHIYEAMTIPKTDRLAMPK